METIDTETLKRSCKANGLSSDGTKADLWARLKRTPGDKKKAKKAAPDTMGPPASYVAKEYASLKTAGFDDEEEINELINKRWQKMQELKAAADTGDSIALAPKAMAEPKDVAEEVALPVYLTVAQAAKSHLLLKNQEINDKVLDQDGEFTQRNCTLMCQPIEGTASAHI